jgi:predicted deacylase
MIKKEISINGKEVLPGQYKSFNISIARLPSRTEIEIPVMIHRAKKEGPVVLLSAGMHGNEVNGIEVVRRIITEKIYNHIVCGTLVLIPIVNIYGFLHFRRTTPDGKDLNRSFPGSQNGSLASMIAWSVTNKILPIIDCGIDFHTGGDMRTNYPQIRADMSFSDNEALACAFGAPFVMDMPVMDSTFRKTAQKQGKSILVYEGGESMRFDDLAIEQAIMGVKRYLNYLDMSNFECSAPHYHFIRKSSWVRAKSSGMFRSLVQYGEKVRKNQVIGIITDPYGEHEQKQKSPNSGYIVGLNNISIVNKGDALFHIGEEV